MDNAIERGAEIMRDHANDDSPMRRRIAQYAEAQDLLECLRIDLGDRVIRAQLHPGLEGGPELSLLVVGVLDLEAGSRQMVRGRLAVDDDQAGHAC